jgi:hypothetical protein
MFRVPFVRLVVAAALAWASSLGHLGAQRPAAPSTPLADAQREYYNANYHSAADQALALYTANPDDLAAYELRTAALLFQVKRLIGEDSKDREKKLKACQTCPDLIVRFQDAVTAGKAVARTRLAASPEDRVALFYLGKLNLNYIWLHLGPLGKRTGWSEYREARRSLETLLKADPSHVRARVARAWIEYIVDTKVMFGVKWVLGGGDRKRALAAVREASTVEAEFFDVVEARFALWEMLTREKRFDDAVVVARELAVEFPLNKELPRFIEAHSKPVR